MWPTARGELAAVAAAIALVGAALWVTYRRNNDDDGSARPQHAASRDPHQTRLQVGI